MAAQKIPVDRSLLTNDQNRALDQWEQFFHGPIWRDIVSRFEPEIEALQNSYHTVQGEQALGRVQGALQIFYRLLVHFPDLIHAEYLLLTGQLRGDEGPSDEDPVQPEDWSR